MVLSNFYTKFHDFSMIIQVFSNSMIFPCMELFLVIFQVFLDFQSLWEPCNVILLPNELNANCIKVFQDMTVSATQADKLESMAREQSNCSLWYQFRKGRLTASNFHEITHSDTKACSSTSLLKKVMHYNASFNSYATNWGIKDEQSAIEEYIQLVSKVHTNFQVRKCGLIVNQCHTYLAASPDSLV